MRRNRTTSPQFSHPEGPRVAACKMAEHLQKVFAGSTLPNNRYTAPPVPEGPHDPTDYPCPIDTSVVSHALLKRLARRKAPGADHLRTEMLLPIAKDIIPVITLLFQLCWKWSTVPLAWRTAQVIPIFKKGNPMDPGNYRPISLTSIMRKLLELCLQEELVAAAPPLDPVQGGFRKQRSALDQALCLHELRRQHKLDHMKEPPVLAFLDIKSAYDTVDRAIIWRALETHISTPLLGILQCLFDDVSIQVLLGGHSSPSFWPRTGVLQGSILSPFLYSIYINSLPELLRSITLPVSSRYFSTMPRRQFGGLWLNCLLYADDVVILGSPEVVRRLLKKAEEHSFSLGYRWNPEKCVVLNCPSQHQAAPYKLYGSAIPSASSFPYLGVPFNSEGAIDTNLLIQRNTASAVSSMRAILQPLGLRSPSFSRLTAARLYTTFIRPKFEYGLCISTFYNYQLDRLEKAQDQCLRIAFGGHQRSSTGVFKHLTNLPGMRARIHTLVLKFIIRFHYLPEDALLPILVPFLNAAPKASRFQWPALCESNPIWSNPEFTGGFTADDRLDYFSTPTNVKSSVLAYRSSQLTIAYNRSRPPVLLMACRPYLGIDPILLIPMSVYDRSRILRWRMGWLPARPRQCRCGHPQASRSHLLSCLRVARRLNVALNTQTNPLDYVLNQLPKKIPSQHSPTLFTRWSFWWPIICCIMFEIEKICLDDTEFSAAAADTSGSLFLHTLKPATQSQTLIADMTESLLLESD